MSSHNDLEYILSIDSDDAHNYKLVAKELLSFRCLKVVTNPNKNIVQALNAGAVQSTGDVLIYVSDDFGCPPNWDLEIQLAVKDSKFDDWVLFVYDGNQKEWQTISILSREYYKKDGYIYYPEYISMFADPEFTETARHRKKVIDGTHLTFKHNHYTVGGLPFDATYAKEESKEAWDHGQALFNKRQKMRWGK